MSRFSLSLSLCWIIPITLDFRVRAMVSPRIISPWMNLATLIPLIFILQLMGNMVFFSPLPSHYSFLKVFLLFCSFTIAFSLFLFCFCFLVCIIVIYFADELYVGNRITTTHFNSHRLWMNAAGGYSNRLYDPLYTNWLAADNADTDVSGATQRGTLANV